MKNAVSEVQPLGSETQLHGVNTKRALLLSFD